MFAESSNKTIIISEINPAGSVREGGCKTGDVQGRCAYDKWVEITNISNDVINTNGYSLSFKDGGGFINNLDLNIGLIGAGKSKIVAYNEVNFVSVLSDAGTTVDQTSGKVRNLSLRETGVAGINLVDESGNTIDSINLNFSFSPDKAWSYERVGHVWLQSTNQFSSNNFGSPGFVSNELLTFFQPVVPTLNPVNENLNIPKAADLQGVAKLVPEDKPVTTSNSIVLTETQAIPSNVLEPVKVPMLESQNLPVVENINTPVFKNPTEIKLEVVIQNTPELSTQNSIKVTPEFSVQSLPNSSENTPNLNSVNLKNIEFVASLPAIGNTPSAVLSSEVLSLDESLQVQTKTSQNLLVENAKNTLQNPAQNLSAIPAPAFFIQPENYTIPQKIYFNLATFNLNLTLIFVLYFIYKTARQNYRSVIKHSLSVCRVLNLTIK